MSPAKLFVSPAPSVPVEFWKGCKTVDLRLDLTDGRVATIQMSVDFARVFAKNLIQYCDRQK